MIARLRFLSIFWCIPLGILMIIIYLSSVWFVCDLCNKWTHQVPNTIHSQIRIEVELQVDELENGVRDLLLVTLADGEKFTN